MGALAVGHLGAVGVGIRVGVSSSLACWPSVLVEGALVCFAFR